MINPEIYWRSEEKVCFEEGCLSLPGIRAEVERHKEVKIRYRNENGVEQDLHADGLLGICVQHEMDHLDGVLFVDHLSLIKRNLLIRKMKKYLRDNNLKSG
jgi:peptide deformylase